jgi:hypothetical protein
VTALCAFQGRLATTPAVVSMRDGTGHPPARTKHGELRTQNELVPELVPNRIGHGGIAVYGRSTQAPKTGGIPRRFGMRRESKDSLARI